MMKKKKTKRPALFPLLMLLTMLCTTPMAIAAAKPAAPQREISAPVTQQPTPQPKPAPQPEPEPVPEPAPEPEPEQEPVVKDDPQTFFADTLFIGDSRTVGLCDYASLNATFFADVGMTVYDAFDSEVSVPGVGKLTLEALLNERQFARIHLMLGINELGYDMDATVAQYGAVVEKIRALQPEAKLCLGANLHVDANRSQTDAIFNNTRINQFNTQIAALADAESIFYIDVNPLFDDANGCLREDLTGDGTHVYAKCYETWGEWLYDTMQ